MSLTKVYFRNINTNLTAFSDPITITNYGNVANRDIGELFDRSSGGGSNVAIFWQESTKSFRLAHTSSTGQENANLAISSNANLRVGNLYAESLNFANGTSISSGIIGGTNTQLQYNDNGNFAGAAGLTTDGTNLTVSGTVFGTTINAAAIGNTGTTLTGTISTASQPNITSLGQLTGLVVAGTVDATTVQATTIGNVGAALLGNGSQITGLTGSQINGPVDNATTAVYVTGLTGTNVNVALGYIPLDSNGTAVSSGTAQYVTQPIQSNITQVGTLGNLSVDGTINTDTVQAATFGNAGAAFTGASYAATVGFIGPLNGTLGTAGGNAAIVSTLSATGNATVNALTVNASAVFGTFLSAYAGVQNTPIGNLSQNTGKFTTLEATAGLQNTIIGNVTPSSATFTTVNITGNLTVGNILTDGYYYANGAPFIGTGGSGATILSNNQLGDGTSVNFTLPAASTTASLIVSINGVVQEPTYAYSVSGSTVTFTAPPVNGDRINFRLLSAGLANFLSDNLGTTGLYYDVVSNDKTATFKTNNVVTMTLDNNGYLNMKSNGFIISTPSITAGTGGAIMDTWDGTVYKAAKYVVTARDSGSTTWTILEALVGTNGASNAAITVYGIVNSGASGTEQVSLSATASAGIVTVTATGAAAGTVVNFEKTYLVGS